MEQSFDIYNVIIMMAKNITQTYKLITIPMQLFQLLLAVVLLNKNIVYNKMQELIKVSLKVKSERPLCFKFYPSMKLSQLVQFLRSCNAPTSAATQHHLCLIHTSSHLLFEYLLNSSHFLLRDLAEVARLSRFTHQERGSDLKRSGVEHQSSPGKSQPLNLTFKESQEGQPLFYFEEQLSYLNSTLQHIHFKSYVFFDQKRKQFLETREVSKATLINFVQFEKVCTIKKTLLQYRAHNFQVFGDLVEMKENKQTIAFCFTYKPSVSVREILCEECSPADYEVLMSKIWAMICDLRRNGLEGFIYEQFLNKRLRHFLEHLSLGIDGRLYLKDLNLIGEAAQQGRFGDGDEKQLLQEIRAYLNQTQNNIPNRCTTTQYREENSQSKLSIFFFSQLYLKKHFTVQKRNREKYVPQTDIFTWKETVTVIESPSVYEAVTTKKQKTKVGKKFGQKAVAVGKKIRFSGADTRDKRKNSR